MDSIASSIAAWRALTSSGLEVYLRTPGKYELFDDFVGISLISLTLSISWTPKHLRRFLNRRNLNKARHILQTCGSYQEK
jgi:hypothetical protein